MSERVRSRQWQENMYWYVRYSVLESKLNILLYMDFLLGEHLTSQSSKSSKLELPTKAYSFTHYEIVFKNHARPASENQKSWLKCIYSQIQIKMNNSNNGKPCSTILASDINTPLYWGPLLSRGFSKKSKKPTNRSKCWNLMVIWITRKQKIAHTKCYIDEIEKGRSKSQKSDTFSCETCRRDIFDK